MAKLKLLGKTITNLDYIHGEIKGTYIIHSVNAYYNETDNI